MLLMGIDTWEPGHRDEIFKRLMEKGPMLPDGVKILGQWADVSGCRTFTLCETDDAKALAQWGLGWSDLIKGEIAIVMDVEEATKLL
jgi:hypothetical protein